MKFNGKGDRIWKSMWITIVSSIWNKKNIFIFRIEFVVYANEVFSIAQLKTLAWLRHMFPKQNFCSVNGANVQKYVLNLCGSKLGVT